MSLRSVLFARPTRPPPVARPSLTLYFLVAGAFLLTLVPHVPQLPVWLSITVVGAMVLRSLIEFYRLPLPSTTFCGAVAVLLLGAIMLQYRTVFGREAGTAFTAGLLAVKFYELRQPRDVALIIFSCFFVVMSALLYSQVLELFIYCLIMMWVLTALLIRVHAGDLAGDNLLRMLRSSGFIFLQAIPFALFLFFFFPRYTGKLTISLDTPTIGLTDTVRPGSISALAQDDTEAMYVHFISGPIPAPDMMYWRALVLWEYNNGAWTPGPLATLDLDKLPEIRAGSDQIEQEITVYPHDKRWLFALDSPISLALNSAEGGQWSRMMTGNVLQLYAGQLDYKARYTVFSSLALADKRASSTERQLGTLLPDDVDPRVKDLAKQLHAGIPPGQDDLYARAVLDYFRHQHFVYSLMPGAQGKDWLPIFLFRTKTGFCEHYASAFAVLMRLGGVPTRLVVGYQGAQFNPYTGNYTVVQSNAHAWDEVWLESRQAWVRFDPTSVLFFTRGAAAAGTGGKNEPLTNDVTQETQSLSDAYLPDWAGKAIHDLQLRREEVETNWDNLVFSYDPEAQSRLAQALGLGPQFRFPLLLGSICLVAVSLVIFRRWMARKTPVPLIEVLYADFCRRMARRGIPRSQWEGPLAYTERVAEAFPDDRAAVQRIGTIVTRVRYGPPPADLSAPQDLKSLLTLLSVSQAATANPRDRR